MSTPLAISCPHCGAGLKLKNNNFVGKKVPCPKCKEPFLVEEPPEDEFLAGGDDDYGAMDDAEEEEEEQAPRSRSKSNGSAKGGKGKGKKKSKSGGGFAPIAMIGGGVVLGLGLLGGIVYGAMALMSGGGSNSWVKWLPDETEVAIQVRVADSINAPIFKPITDNPTLAKLMNQPPMPGNGGADPAAAFFQGLGVQAKDINTITVGIVNGMAMIANNQMGPKSGPQQFVAVVHLKTAVEESKLAQAPATVLAKEDYQGKAIYAVVGSANPKVYVHAVDSTTYLVGSDAELKAAINSKGSAPAAKRFAFADDKSSFLFVAAPKDESRLKALGISTLQVSRSGGTTDTGEVDGIHGMSYGFTLGTDLKVEMKTSLSRSMAKATAEQMKKEMDVLRPQLQAQMNQAGGFNPFISNDMLKKVLGHVDTMLGSAQATSSGSTATLTMTLSGQIVADGVQMAAPFMPMLEGLVKQQQAGAPARMTGMPAGFGNSAVDVTGYPAAVINTGENAKARIGNMADQHNADVQAQMQEGGGHAASPGANNPQAMMQNPGGAHAATGPSAAMLTPMPAGGGGHAAAPGANDPQAMMQAPGGAHAATGPAAGAQGGGGGHAAPPGGNNPQAAMQAGGGGHSAPPGGADPQAQMQAAGGGGHAAPPGGAGANPQAAAMQEQMRRRQQDGAGGAPAAGDPNAQMQQQMQNGAGGQPPAAEVDKSGKPVPKSRSRRRTGSK